MTDQSNMKRRKQNRRRFYMSRRHDAGSIRAYGPASDGIFGVREETATNLFCIAIGQTFSAKTEFLSPPEALRLWEALGSYLEVQES